MDNEPDGQVAGAEAATEETVVAPSQVEAPTQETSEDTAEQQTGAVDTGQADETGAAPKKKPWWEKRFDELTAKRYEAENQAAYWRGKAEAGTGQQAEAQQEGPPTEDQFATWDDYQEALIEYKVDQRIKQEDVKRQRGAVLQTYEERAAKFTESHPDYQQVALGEHVKITQVMAEVIRESDLGPQVAYELGSNPTEAQRIANLPPHRQAAELGKIEARLSLPAAAPSPKPIPPEPPKTVSGIASATSKKPEEMSMAEYIDWVKVRDK